MIRDDQHPGYWKNTKYCPKHIHLEKSQSSHCSIDKDDYNTVDCNVSRYNQIWTDSTASYLHISYLSFYISLELIVTLVVKHHMG